MRHSRDTWSTPSDHSDSEYFNFVVYVLLNCSMFCIHTVCWESLLLPTKLVLLVLDAFQISLSSPHLVLGFFNAYLHQNQIYCRVGFHIQVICCGVQYMRVSGPVCILLCYPVMSGEVYKKNRWSLAQTKVEIKRSYSFSLGWYSSKEWNAL